MTLLEKTLREIEARDAKVKELLARCDEQDRIDSIDAHVSPPSRVSQMFYGLVGEVGQAASASTEVNPVAASAAFLAFLSAQCGRDVYLPVGNVWHHARLFTLHVGRSGLGRKGEALSLTYRIQKEIEAKHQGLLGQHHTGGLSSREGMASLIHDGYMQGKTKVEPIDDKRLFIVESEFSNVLHQGKREGNTLSSALRDAWDGISIKPAVKTQRMWASDPHIALAGQITPRELLEVIEHRELSNGFANRFVIFWAERAKLVPHPFAAPKDVVADLAERTAKVVRFAKGNYPYTKDSHRASLTPPAMQRYSELYPELANPLESDLMTALMERRAPYLLRLALLFALTDLTLNIEVKHIEAALAWVKYWEQSVRFIFSPMVDLAHAEARKEAQEKILSYLDKHQEVDRLTLRRTVFYDRIGPMDDALDALLAEQAIEAIEAERSDGKPGRKRKIYKRVFTCIGTLSPLSVHSCESKASEEFLDAHLGPQLAHLGQDASALSVQSMQSVQNQKSPETVVPQLTKQNGLSVPYTHEKTETARATENDFPPPLTADGIALNEVLSKASGPKHALWFVRQMGWEGKRTESALGELVSYGLAQRAGSYYLRKAP